MNICGRNEKGRGVTDACTFGNFYSLCLWVSHSPFWGLSIFNPQNGRKSVNLIGLLPELILTKCKSRGKSTSNYETRTISETQLIISTGVNIIDKSIYYIHYNPMFSLDQTLTVTFLLRYQVFLPLTCGGEPSEVIQDSCFYIKHGKF